MGGWVGGSGDGSGALTMDRGNRESYGRDSREGGGGGSWGERDGRGGNGEMRENWHTCHRRRRARQRDRENNGPRVSQASKHGPTRSSVGS